MMADVMSACPPVAPRVLDQLGAALVHGRGFRPLWRSPGGPLLSLDCSSHTVRVRGRRRWRTFFPGEGIVLAWLPPAGLALGGGAAGRTPVDGFCVGFGVGCVCIIPYLLSRYMRPYWIMTAAGFSYTPISRPGPALPILARLPDLPPLSPPGRRRREKTKQ